MVGFLRTRAQPEESAAVRLAVFGALATAAAALGIYGGLGPTAVGCTLVAAAGHRWSWRHRHGSRRLAQAVVGLAIMGATLTLLAELFVVGNGPDRFPQGTFLLVLIATTSFDVRSRANCYSSLALGFLGIYAAASVAYDDSVIVVIVVFAALVLTVLGLATRADVDEGGQAWHAVGSTDPRRSSRAGSVRALAGVVAALTLGGTLAYVALPPYDGPLPVYPASADLRAAQSFDGQVLNPLVPLVSSLPYDRPRSAYYGFASELRLGRYGLLDRTILMRVRSTGWSYWRMQTFDTYTGRSWKAATGYANELDRGPDGALSPAAYPVEDHASIDSGPTIRETFMMAQGGSNLVAVADHPVRLYFPADRLWQRLDAGDLLADQPLPAGTTYTVVSRLPVSDPRVLRAARGPEPSALGIQYRELPPLPPVVRQAAAAATAGAATRYDRVMGIITYLQAHARYDLGAPPLGPGQEGVATLLATKRGFCEQFATALTVLARLAGIPARLVTGFAPGEYDPIARLFTVRASDAHAWTEIYFPGRGWIPFDATPSYGAEPRAHGIGGWLLGSLVGPRLPRPDWTALVHGTGRVSADGGAAAAALVTAATHAVAATHTALAWAALLLVVAGLLGRRRRAAGGTRAGRRREVLRAYLAAERRLQRRGYPSRPPPVTPRRYVAALAPDQRHASLAALAELAMRAAYGRDDITPDDVAAATVLRRALRPLASRHARRGPWR